MCLNRILRFVRCRVYRQHCDNLIQVRTSYLLPNTSYCAADRFRSLPEIIRWHKYLHYLRHPGMAHTGNISASFFYCSLISIFHIFFSSPTSSSTPRWPGTSPKCGRHKWVCPSPSTSSCSLRTGFPKRATNLKPPQRLLQYLVLRKRMASEVLNQFPMNQPMNLCWALLLWSSTSSARPLASRCLSTTSASRCTRTRSSPCWVTMVPERYGNCL
jgi:hypothetical protein